MSKVSHRFRPAGDALTFVKSGPGGIDLSNVLARPGAQGGDWLAQRPPQRGKKALADFLAADIAINGAPMYNFSISSQLKASIDRLAVAGKTFRYTEKGPEGLAGGKRVIIASSRGGFYGPRTPTAFLDHQQTYLRNVFGFFGITDLTFIRAEGVNVGPDQRSAAIAGASAEIAALAA